MRKQMQDEMIEKISVLEMKFRQIKDTAQTAMFITCVVLLQNIKKKCAEALPENRISFYVEVFDGILLALQKREKMNRENLNEVCDLCTELLQFVKKEFLKEKITKEKKEILFLPYKASMWDSLESIWRAAAADKEHCEAYVMPIPYCDRNPDGSAAHWHCEADLFPEDVPVIDYREYDLKERRPDIIYIHNPYDGNNRVTSVAPEYYSDELKKYTDMLVYVPYFVTGERIEPHFCQVPGVINADKVIVESEVIKMQYEKYYPVGDPSKDKILALGSPKFDKVVQSKREDYELPHKWKKLIRNKKVVLYNTSIKATLEHSEHIIEKMKYVFSVFKSRGDVVLWWRPHPLLKSTIDSMLPQIADEYRALEKEYIEASWGIYDDTADLHRAICWSDAYYGDESSVIWLYKLTGKAIMIQGISNIYSEYQPLYFEYMAVENQFIWFVSTSSAFSGLFEMNIETGEINCLGELPILCKTRREFVVLEKIKNKIIIAPYFSNSGFIEYNIENKKFDIVQMKQSIWKNEIIGMSAFANVVKYNDKLFFIGNANGLIVEYDSVLQQYIYHTSWTQDVEQLLNVSEIFFWRNSYVQIENKIFIAIINTNKIIEIDLDFLQSKCHCIPFNVELAGAFFVKGFFWLTVMKGNFIIKWSFEENKFQQVNLPLDSEVDIPVAGIVGVDGGLLILPCLRKDVFFIDDEKNILEHVFDMEKVISKGRDFRVTEIEEYAVIKVRGDEYDSFALQGKKGVLQIFNSAKKEIIELKLFLEDNILKNIYEKSYAKNAGIFVYEGDCINLIDMLVLLQHSSKLVLRKSVGNIGEKVHNELSMFL